MKFITSITLTILFFSCQWPSHKTEELGTGAEAWEITYRSVSSHTYTPAGLVDSSFEKVYLYNNKIVWDTSHSVTVRKYNGSNKLISQKDYVLGEGGLKSLSTETMEAYDKNGNVISEIHKTNVDTLTKSFYTYDVFSNVISTVTIFLKMDERPESYSLDSVVVHRHDRKQLQYDTTVQTFEYNANRKCIRSEKLNTRQKGKEITYTRYAGDEKLSSFTLNLSGDTLATVTYEHTGNLIKEIHNFREAGFIDIFWLDKGKIIQSISHSHNSKNKSVITYNEKGDEIESISFK